MAMAGRIGSLVAMAALAGTLAFHSGAGAQATAAPAGARSAGEPDQLCNELKKKSPPAFAGGL
jgi:hypothetical protein